jgi:hypothetical protein
LCPFWTLFGNSNYSGNRQFLVFCFHILKGLSIYQNWKFLKGFYETFLFKLALKLKNQEAHQCIMTSSLILLILYQLLKIQSLINFLHLFQKKMFEFCHGSVAKNRLQKCCDFGDQQHIPEAVNTWYCITKKPCKGLLNAKNDSFLLHLWPKM